MKDKDNLYKIGLLTAFISLLALGLYLFLESRSTANNQQQDMQVSNVVKEKDQELSWETYENKQFGYTLQHPRLLSIRETTDQGGYLHFVRFEENTFSQGKGVAVGVSEDTINEQVKKIKKAMEQDGNAKLTEEMDTNIDGNSAVKVTYQPSATELGESRAILVIGKSPYTYSISTVPEQIDDVLNGFEFTVNDETDDGGEDVFCGGIANIPCPQGFGCVLDGDYPDAGGICVKE